VSGALIQRPVLVLGASYPALDIVQSLGLRGVACWACAPGRPIATRSRYARYWRIPDPRRDRAGLLRRVAELAARLDDMPILLPTEDPFIKAVAGDRSEYEIIAQVCASPIEVVDLLLDKLRFNDWARARGLRHPKAVAAPAFDPAGPLPFPLVAKPRHPFYGPGLPAFGPDAPNLPDELRFVLLEDRRGWEDFRLRQAEYLPHLVVQTFVPGSTPDMFSLGIYADRASEVKGLFVGRKIRGSPPLFGDARAGQNDVVPDAVVSEVVRVVRELGFSGIAEFEYKRDPQSGELHLIEINPRSWSWIGMTTGSAVDIPWIAYQDLVGPSGSPPRLACQNQDPGAIKHVRILWDFLDVVVRYRWTYPAWAMSPRSWLRSLRAKRLVMVEFDRADWPVAAWSLVYLVADLTSWALRVLRRKLGRARAP